MALSGIQIYKLLPQTNCKDCGFPTCLAFAMKLAAKQVELSSCPHVSTEAKAQLAESSAPPIRLVTIKSKNREVKAGNETVLFRHEKTFYNKPGVFIRIKDNQDSLSIEKLVKGVDAYHVNYVGIDLRLDGFAIEDTSGDAEKFFQVLKLVRAHSSLPLILISENPAVVSSGMQTLSDESPLIMGATPANWEAMAAIAKGHPVSLAASSPTIDELVILTENLKNKGVEDIVLHPSVSTYSSILAFSTQIRRLSLKKNFRLLGYPILVDAHDIDLAAQAIAKYAGFIIIDEFSPQSAYPLLVLRQNIYTDPQKPIQVQPGLYEINRPQPDSPVLVTTNFSITYFSVANEVEGSGFPAWLLVTDAEGMSVLTAWAAGKFDAERIAKAVKTQAVDKVTKKVLVLPGNVAVLSGEVEAELPGWQVKVGPREAVDIPKFLKLGL
jgi:acetyl-CoA decarbonylase/synthase, CODH/ACS complex subunit gamma